MIESATNLDSAAAWSLNTAVPFITNHQNQVVVQDGNGGQFFRLRRP
jgi:hypothetical protein